MAKTLEHVINALITLPFSALCLEGFKLCAPNPYGNSIVLHKGNYIITDDISVDRNSLRRTRRLYHGVLLIAVITQYDNIKPSVRVYRHPESTKSALATADAVAKKAASYAFSSNVISPASNSKYHTLQIEIETFYSVEFTLVDAN